jgi:hypothetical protein
MKKSSLMKKIASGLSVGIVTASTLMSVGATAEVLDCVYDSAKGRWVCQAPEDSKKPGGGT